MSNYVSVDHLKFLLREVHGFEEVLDLKRFADYDMDSIDMLLDTAKQFSDQELYPYSTEMDRVGVKYENGSITAHPQVKNVMQKAGESGFICSYFDYEQGGSQMPHTAAIAANFITSAANNSAVGYIGLTSGAAGLIRSFGNKELFDTYVPNMIAGKWQGTMALTEPQAGSSLSDIVSTASPADDGSYQIRGQKIFISSGDHQCVENVVHLLLARIDGAPSGTKGISLFVVPKKRVKSNGSLESNDVFTAGEIEKMGQRGYVTTHLVFGENDNCHGFLVGDPNKGLKYMFQMMNGARIEVGLTAASIASAAYYASLQYAKERPQGRKLNNSGEKNLNEDQTLIINHPDVRRMLFLQKSIVEGSASLLLFCGKLLDLSRHSESDKDKEKYQDLLEILTPIAKTYPSEAGIISVSNGMQVLGGYGFTTDFPLEQYYRDVRIAAIYEGTTGIQSLDLLGRKVTMKDGAALKLLVQEINNSISTASDFEELSPYSEQLKNKIEQVQKVLAVLIGYAMKGEYEKFLADASIFMELLSIVVISWQWLLQATAAKKALMSSNLIRSEQFYLGQIHTMKFYFKYELPKTLGLSETLMNQELLTVVNNGKVVEAFA